MINWQDYQVISELRYQKSDDEHTDKIRFECGYYRLVRLEEAKRVVDEYLRAN